VRDRDEDVRLGCVPEHDLERLRGRPAGESGVERRPAAGEEDTSAFGQPQVADTPRNLAEPVRLGGNRLAG
jgi:hypothetical protein